MKSIIKKSLAGASIAFMLLSLSPVAVYGEDTAQDLEIVRTKVLQIQATEPSLPGGVSEQKGRVGTLLSKLFDTNGKIGNYFLKALGTRNNNTVLKWVGGAGGQLVDSSITDNGASVGIGIPLNVTGTITADKLNINGDFASGAGGSIGIIRGTASNQSIITFTDSTLGNQRGGIGLAAGSNDFTVTSNSTANLLLRSFGSQNIQLLPGTGGVGIGKVPSYDLDVAGDINFTGDLRQNGVVFAGSGGGKFVDGTPTATNAVYTAGNVGIGTTNPDSILQIRDSNPVLDIENTASSAGSGGKFRFGHDQVGNTTPIAEISGYLTNGSASRAGHLLFSTSNLGVLSEKLRINNNGNVGIGTDSPSERLSVAGNGTFTGTVTAATPTLAGHLTTKGYVDAAVAGVGGDDLGDHTADQNIRLNGQWLSNDGGNEGVFVDTDGDVGIGTSSPNQKLDINGSLALSGNIYNVNTANILFEDTGGTPRTGLQLSSGDQWSLLGGVMTTNSATNGNVGIGVSDPTDAKLQVNGNIIALDPTENSHVATKVYVDNAVTTASNNNINGLTDGKTSATNLFLGDNVGDNATGGDNTSVGQYSFLANTTGVGNTVLGKAALQSNTTGDSNTAVGLNTLSDNTTGNGNVAVGISALNSNTTANNNVAVGRLALTDNTVGFSNTAIGGSALENNLDGDYNTALGNLALRSNTTGGQNTGLGYGALSANTGGTNNTAVGYISMSANTTGNNNVALGHDSLNDNTTGAGNIAIGKSALKRNTTANYNVGIGYFSLNQNLTGYGNAAVGFSSLRNNTTGYANAALGYGALYSNTTGPANTAVGYDALRSSTGSSSNTAVGYRALRLNTSGGFNSAFGRDALYFNTSGGFNTGIGSYALHNNTTGDYNAALGYAGLYLNTTGVANIGIGHNALYNNTSGNHNIGVGYTSLQANTTGDYNIGLGSYTLVNNTTGVANTGLGYNSLALNTTGNYNTALGYAALDANTTADNNLALGYYALGANTTGAQNTALGTVALDSVTTGDYNTGVGYNTLGGVTTGQYNTAIGGLSGVNVTTGSNNITIGYGVNATSAAASNELNIGNTIYGDLNSDNVGIGIVPGTDKFRVAGDISVQDKIRNNERNDYIQLDPADDSFKFVSNDTERFRIQSDGDVGIGQPNPTAKLHIVNGGQRVRFLTGTNTSGYGLDVGVNDDGVNFDIASASRGFNFSNNNGTLLSIAPGGASTFSSTVTAATPTAAGHLTTKGYVDSAISGAGSNYVTLTGNQTIAGTKTFTSPIQSTGTFDINGSTAGAQQNGLYVATFGATSGTTNNPTYTNAIAAQTSGSRSIALSVDGAGYIWGFRSHSSAGGEPFTFQSKAKFADNAGTLDGINSTGFIQVGTSGDQIQDGTIDSSEIQDNTLAAVDLATNSVNADEIATDAVRAAEIQDGAVRTQEILDNTITAADLAPNSVGTSEVANNTLTADDLAADSVGASELANNSVVSGNIVNGTIISSDIADNSITATDLAPNSVGNSELIDIPTFTNVIGTAAPTANTHLTNKLYVDNLVTQGVSWKAPVTTSASATYGACDTAKEGWATYNKSDDIIYLCNASAWVSIGSSASIPFASTSNPGRVQLSGDLGGTWNNVQLTNNSVVSANIVDGTITSGDILNNTVASTDILNDTITASDIGPNAINNSELAGNSVAGGNIIDNTITEADITDSFIARNSSLLDGIDSANFLRSDTDDTFNGRLTVSRTAHTAGANTSTMELYSPDTGDSNNEVSLRFHQGNRYYGQMRFRNGGFRFTQGNDDVLVPISAGTPTVGDHLATKSYVDLASSSLWSLSGNEIDSEASRYVDINNFAAIGTSATPATNAALTIGETSFAGNTDRTTYQLYNSETIGATTLTGNRTSYGTYVFLNNNKGGTATSGNRSYATGIYGFTRNTGAAYAYQNIGGQFEGRNESTAGAQNIKGVIGTARQFDGAGNSNVANMVGGEFIALGRSSPEAGTTTVTTAKGSYSVAQAYKSDITNAYGMQGYTLTNNGHDGNITNAYGVHGSVNADSDDGGTITNGWAGYFHSYGRNTAPLMTSSKGIYAEANDGVTAMGGHFVADDSRATNNYAVYATASNGSGVNYAIYAPTGNNYFGDDIRVGAAMDFYDTNSVAGGPDIEFQSSGLVAAQDNLHINVDSDGNNATRAVIFGANTGTSAASEIMRIVEDGNVGIGTNSPAANLHVNKPSLAVGLNDMLRIQGSIGDFGATPTGTAILFKNQDGNNLTNEARIKMMTVNATTYGDNDEAASNLLFETTNGGVASDKMIITGRGNIGIGTVNPGYKLDVSGTGRFTGTVIGATPTATNHLTTKAYVDGLVSGSGDNLGNHAATTTLDMNNNFVQQVRGLFMGWSTTYGVQFNHGLFSHDGSGYSDDMLLNSYGNVRINMDTNNNDGAETFEIGNHTTDGTSNTFLTLNNVGNTILTPSAPAPASGIDSFGLRTSGLYGGGIGLQDGTGNFGIWLDTAGTNMRFGHGSSLGALTTRMTLNSAGAVTATSFTGNGAGLTALAGDNITDNTIDSSEIQNNSLTASDLAANSVGTSEVADNSLTASDLAANSVGNSELIDLPTVTQLNLVAGTGNGIRFWSSDTYEMSMGNSAEYQYGPVTDYAIKTSMSNNAGRGWVWGVTGSTPVFAVERGGAAQLSGAFTAGSFIGNGAGLTALAGDNITDGTIDSSEIQDNTISAADILNNTITSGDVLNNTLTNADIADGTVRTNEITDNTITETDISDSFVARNSQLLDGIDGAALLRSNASDDFTGGDLRIIRNSTNEIETSGDTSQFEIQQSNTNGDAYMTFHIASDYAVNFGLDGETNDLVVGGWSLGAAKYRILREGHTGDYIADNTIDNTEIQNGTLTYTDTNVNSIQRRITGTCAAGSSIRAIANNGTVTCETDDTGSGGDNLGNHTATTTLAMGTSGITSSAGTIRDGGGGWVRTYGSTGWYNGTYGGGWYMTDSTWLRSYVNKSIITGGVMRADGGFQVDGTAVIDGSAWVVGDRIQQNSIDSSEIQNESIVSADIDDGTITAADLAANSVAASEIATNAVGAAEIAAGAVGTSEVADNSLTASDLAANSVGTSEIATNGVGNAEMIDAPTFTTVTATTFTYSSDRRLKKNFKPLDYTNKILGLGTYRFDWKKDGTSDIGFIAQEVEEIYPEFIHINDDGYKTVDYAKMVVPLLEVTKKQQAEIDELRSMIEELQNK